MWITNAKEASVKETAVALGFTMMTPRSISPCPSCGVEARGTSDKKRGPVGFSAAQDSWKCHACSASGDVVDFVSIHSYGSHYRDLGVNEKIVVRNWFARHGYCKPIYSDRPTGVPTQIEEKKRSLNRPADVLASRPPIDELKELWGKTKTLEEALQDKAGWSDPLVGCSRGSSHPRFWTAANAFAFWQTHWSTGTRSGGPTSGHQRTGWLRQCSSQTEPLRAFTAGTLRNPNSLRTGLLYAGQYQRPDGLWAMRLAGC